MSDGTSQPEKEAPHLTEEVQVVAKVCEEDAVAKERAESADNGNKEVSRN